MEWSGDGWTEVEIGWWWWCSVEGIKVVEILERRQQQDDDLSMNSSVVGLSFSLYSLLFLVVLC